MFTGIIEATGKLVTVISQSVQVETKLPNLMLGESISVNGVCLTVSELGPTFFNADLSEETIARTALSDLAPGDIVNLERPLRPTDRFGGHIVQGHVDGTGVVEEIETRSGSIEMTISIPSHISRYLVEKGSISVDGVSLTVVRFNGDRFTVSLIPHTLASTNLSQRAVHDRVNIEVDVLAKYVERLLASGMGVREGE